ncbi:MAG: wax ester/triacylglycerol synthase family O-acyltransferase, partial [Rhodococcus sp.]|nr:wax ester/triacylglycerol synthase family O-acyltransferase [Rhodococcus sp. (in: high G+C Gram-positive bacteria)]
MNNRLSAQDASFYYLEAGSTPMHVGSLAIVRPPRNGFGYDKLVELVGERLRLVPRYRQKVREVALGLARPVWVDDQDFDIEYHVRRSALPKPGSEAQLHELIARLISRPLDNTRPLWEMYLVEGLARNRVAIFTKSHSALVDGESALDIGHVIIGSDKQPQPLEEELWMPSAEPGPTTLVLGALTEMVARPAEAASAARAVASDVASMLAGPVRAVEKAAAVLRTAASPAPSNPLNAPISRSRRFAVVKTELEPYRKIRARYGCAINDVILAVITGALRNWLLSRGEPVAEDTTVRAMVPISVYPDSAAAANVSDLPVTAITGD